MPYVICNFVDCSLFRVPGGRLSRLKQGVLGNPVEGCPDRLTDSAFDMVSNLQVTKHVLIDSAFDMVSNLQVTTNQAWLIGIAFDMVSTYR